VQHLSAQWTVSCVGRCTANKCGSWIKLKMREPIKALFFSNF
jgi:hypothetical protein